MASRNYKSQSIEIDLPDQYKIDLFIPRYQVGNIVRNSVLHSSFGWQKREMAKICDVWGVYGASLAKNSKRSKSSLGSAFYLLTCSN